MLAFRMKAWLPPPATELQVNVGIIIADKRNAVKLTAHVNNQGNMPIQIKCYIKIGFNNTEKKNEILLTIIIMMILRKIEKRLG